MAPGTSSLPQDLFLNIDMLSIFCHARETPSRTGLTVGSTVSFTYVYDDKGGKAVDVQVEEGAEEDGAEREVGFHAIESDGEES